MFRRILLSTALASAFFALPAMAQTITGNGGAAAASSGPTGTAGIAAPGANASVPEFDAVTGKGLLTAGTPLPAGTNALGSVGVTSLPSTPSGTNTIGNVLMLPTGATSTETAITGSATAGTFTSALAASATRLGCFEQNTSTGVMYVYLGATASATLANSVQISAGGSFGCSPPGSGLVLRDQVNVAFAAANGTAVSVSQ